MVGKVDSYSWHINKVSNMLNSFVKRKHIVPEEMTVIDALVNTSLKNQVTVLNDNLLTIEYQRVLFGALRNIKNVAKIMGESLKTASARKENPITAEVCLGVIPYMKNLSQALDNFFSRYGKMPSKYKTELLTKIREFSRMLHKKAIHFGFPKKTIDEQELNMEENEMRKFIDDINIELKLNTEIDEEPPS